MGKWLMFLMVSWFGLTMLSASMAGGGGLVATSLTADISATDDELLVTSTDGFNGSGGVITVGTERILYFDTTATKFQGSAAPPHALERGYDGTTAVAHSSGEKVYTLETDLLNNSLQMSVVRISDSSGFWKAIDMGIGFFSGLGTFLTAPFGLLGSGMAWVTMLWAVFGLAFIMVLFIALAGGRRV